MIVGMVREIRIYRYEQEEDLPEIRDICEKALAEHSPLLQYETGFDFDRRQISFLLAFANMPDCLGFACSKEAMMMEVQLSAPLLIHRYWRENDA